MTYYITQLFIELYSYKNIMQITDITQIKLYIWESIRWLVLSYLHLPKKYKYFLQIDLGNNTAAR